MIVMNKLLELAVNKLGHDWYNLNWEFRDFDLEDGTPDKMSQWQGDPADDIMIVVFKGKHISEPFHRQDFFFIDYAYHLDYNALSSNSITSELRVRGIAISASPFRDMHFGVIVRMTILS